MKYDNFKEVLKLNKELFDKLSELDKLGFNFYENKRFPLVELIDKSFMETLKSHYTDTGVDWVTWFVYDNSYGTGGLKAYDGEKEILKNLKQLHSYINKHHKLKD